MNSFPLALVVLFTVTFLLCLSGARANESDRLKVLALLPLSGSLADQGTWAREGFLVAQADLAQSGNPVSLEIEDSKADPRTAVDLWTRELSKRRPTAVFSYGSGVGMALSPLANSERIVQIGVATGTPAYRSVGDFTFRVFHSASDEGEILAQHVARKFSGKRVALIHVENEYGTSMMNVVRRGLASRAITIVADEAIDPRERDYRSVALRLKTKSPDIIVLTVYSAEGAVLLKQLSEVRLHPHRVASGAILGGDEFFALVGDNADGLEIVNSCAYSPERPSTAAFQKRYQEQFGRARALTDCYSARAFDALRIAANASRRCASIDDAECLKRELFNTKDFDGASGVISFDEAGDIRAELSLLQVKGRAYHVLHPSLTRESK